MKYGAENGWSTTAVGPVWEDASAAGKHLAESVPASVSIVRFHESKLRPSWKFFPRIDGGFLNAIEAFEAARRAYGAAAPDVVVATGPAFYSFVAALFSARYWRVPLVLDYRDEWTECPFSFVAPGNMDRYWEDRCLQAAQKVVFTTSSHLEHQLAAFPRLTREKCELIPNGWDPADREGVHGLSPADPSEKPIDGGKIEIAYVGTLGEHASPQAFLASLQAVLKSDDDLQRRVRVAFVGRSTPELRSLIEGCGLPDNVVVKGQVPKPEANRVMNEATILLQIAVPDLRRYIPGKLYEYIASGRPVLVYGHEGEASRIVRELNAGIAVPEGDHDGLRRAILTLSERPTESGVAGERADWLARHDRGVLAARMFASLNRLITDSAFKATRK